MKIQTTNTNGRNHKLSTKKFNVRLAEIFAEFENDLPDIWGLQENATGGCILPCIKKLKELAAANGYTLIMPGEENWIPAENPRSIFNALLLKDVKEYEVLSLDNSIELHSRYNYVKVSFKRKPEEEFYIFNIHVPQNDFFPGRKTDDPYVAKRKHLSDIFYKVLEDEVNILVSLGNNVIVMGDFNRSIRDHALKSLIKLGLKPVFDGIKRTNYGPVKAMSIDNILVSESLANRTSNLQINQDISKVKKLTDHATVSIDLS